MKIESGLKSSTFKKVPKDTHKYNSWRDNGVTSCYQDENGIICIFSKSSSLCYFDIRYNGKSFIWSGRPLKVGIRECLRMVSEFLMKYDITLITEENAGENMHIRDAIFELERNIME